MHARIVLSDIRFAFRLLRRNPGFTATLLGVLIAGLGAVTAMFSLVMSLLVRPLPYPHPEELTMIWEQRPWNGPASLPDFVDLKAQASSYSKLTAMTVDTFSLSTAPEEKGAAAPESVVGSDVSGDFFPLFGIAPLRGRLLGPDDDKVGGPKVAVIGADLWHRRFGSDPAILGKSVILNTEPYTVVGIAPEGFRYGGPWEPRVEVWTPISVTIREYSNMLNERGSHWLWVIGRLARGVSIEAANAQLAAISTNLTATYPETNTNVKANAVDLHEQLVDGYQDSLWMLFGAVALVFIVICANVANLLLARTAARRPEIAVRVALGATSRRLATQLVVETVIVFLLGAMGATIAAHWLVQLFAHGLITGAAVRTIDVGVDWTAFAFALAVAFVCAFVSGLLPAGLASRVAPQSVLVEGQARVSIGRPQRILRGALVVAQVAIAFALLVGVGLSLRGFIKSAEAPDGFDADNLAATAINLPGVKYAEDTPKITRFFEDVMAKVAAEPGVTAVAATRSIPVAPKYSNGNFTVEGRPRFPPGSDENVEFNIVSPGYFKMMGIPVLRGREFTAADVLDGRRVMVIGKAAADRYFAGEDPIGRRMEWGGEDEGKHERFCEIIGIVDDVPQRGRGGKRLHETYVPLAQSSLFPALDMHIVARTARPAALLQAMPRIVASVDQSQAVTQRRIVREMADDVLAHQRFAIQLLSAFAAAALLLATIGIFGLVSYTTNQRTRELGIRLALGSSPERVLGIVMRQGMALLSLGLAVGGVGSVWVGRALAERVNGTKAFDPLVFAAIFGALAMAGTIASLLPALRAIRIPPAAALRHD